MKPPIMGRPLRRVVGRTEPGACSTWSSIEEVYECGHVEHHAPLKEAKRRRCIQCARIGYCLECKAVRGATHEPDCDLSNP